MLVHVDTSSDVPLYQQIYMQIRDAAISGVLSEGDRLVSIRRLSKDLSVSHTTVEQAYLQLSVEGLVINVPRSGYVVAHIDTEYFKLARSVDQHIVDELANMRNRRAFFAENREGKTAQFDFSYANLQSDSFPVSTWRKFYDEVLYSKIAPELARYSYTDEKTALQDELAGMLARTRGVNCSSEQVIVGSGTGDSLTMILQLFEREKDVLGMEEPGYPTVPEVARRCGFAIAPLVADQGGDAFLNSLDKQCPSIVFTTPSHQFPTGTLLQLDHRTRLLKWAEANDAYIIEDDSCNEFRYDTRPIPSLQSLDAFGRVIYLGNVSKALSPSLRISYTVLPPRLLERYWNLFNSAHPSVSWIERETLARFIASGQWDAHVRKTAQGNRHRHDELLRCLRGELGDIVSISGEGTGMHLYVTVHNGMSEKELVTSALEHGVKVYSTSHMRIAAEPEYPSLMIGFSAIAYEDIEPGIAALKEAWLG